MDSTFCLQRDSDQCKILSWDTKENNTFEKHYLYKTILWLFVA